MTINFFSLSLREKAVILKAGYITTKIVLMDLINISG